jgi:hypothetical protein
MSIWQDMVTLLRESVLIQGVVTLMMLSVVCYATIANVPLSEQFWAVTGLVIGYWFGSKAQASTNEAIRRINNMSRNV